MSHEIRAVYNSLNVATAGDAAKAFREISNGLAGDAAINVKMLVMWLKFILQILETIGGTG